jgi:hypothetical protein
MNEIVLVGLLVAVFLLIAASLVYLGVRVGRGRG